MRVFLCLQQGKEQHVPVSIHLVANLPYEQLHRSLWPFLPQPPRIACINPSAWKIFNWRRSGRSVLCERLRREHLHQHNRTRKKSTRTRTTYVRRKHFSCMQLYNYATLHEQPLNRPPLHLHAYLLRRRALHLRHRELPRDPRFCRDGPANRKPSQTPRIEQNLSSISFSVRAFSDG